MHLVEIWNRHSKLIKTCLLHLLVYQIVCKRHRILPFIFLISGWTQCKLLRLRLLRRHNKNRATIELRSTAVHCTCTTAWSFDRPVRTGDVIKLQVVLSPGRSATDRSKPKRVNDVYGVGLRPLACWDCGFKSHRKHGWLSVVSVECFQVKVSATRWSLVQRSPTDCGSSLFVI